MTPVSFLQISSSLVAHSSPPAPRPLLVLVFKSLYGPWLYHPHTGTYSPLTHSQRHSQRVPRVDCGRFAELGEKDRVAQDFVSSPRGLWVPTSVGTGSCTVSWTRYMKLHMYFICIVIVTVTPIPEVRGRDVREISASVEQWLKNYHTTCTWFQDCSSYSLIVIHAWLKTKNSATVLSPICIVSSMYGLNFLRARLVWLYMLDNNNCCSCFPWNIYQWKC